MSPVNRPAQPIPQIKMTTTAYQRVQFMLSAAALSQAPPDAGREVAFAGRSNAGKSSAINAITGIGGLARTSKTPGRTQQINFFRVDDARRLVDLPGYGFAKVPLSVKRQWEQLLAQYLQRRESLRGLVLVMDIRHPFKPVDRQLLEWCRVAGMHAHLLLTKADKLSRGAALDALRQVRQALQTEGLSATAQLFSALTRAGVDEARQTLDVWLGCGPADTADGGG